MKSFHFFIFDTKGSISFFFIHMNIISKMFVSHVYLTVLFFITVIVQ